MLFIRKNNFKLEAQPCEIEKMAPRGSAPVSVLTAIVFYLLSDPEPRSTIKRPLASSRMSNLLDGQFINRRTMSDQRMEIVRLKTKLPCCY